MLESKGKDPMTIDEVKWFIDPTGMTWADSTITTEELQKRAGLVVEKTIKPYNP